MWAYAGTVEGLSPIRGRVLTLGIFDIFRDPTDLRMDEKDVCGDAFRAGYDIIRHHVEVFDSASGCRRLRLQRGVPRLNPILRAKGACGGAGHCAKLPRTFR